MLLDIYFMHEHGVQLHCSTGEFRVGACLTIQPMFKVNSPSVQAFSVCRVRLPPLSVGVINCEITEAISDFILESIDKSETRGKTGQNRGFFQSTRTHQGVIRGYPVKCLTCVIRRCGLKPNIQMNSPLVTSSELSSIEHLIEMVNHGLLSNACE